MSKGRVIVALSGGVDSAVAAALLKEEGYEVTGVTMAIWDGKASGEAGGRHACYGPGETEDIEDARRVAQRLGIPFYVFDLKSEYRASVLDYFRRQYLAGRTPNPCVMCNRWVKFGALMEKARHRGIEFDYFATGHYARVEYDGTRGRYLLKKARDWRKDQSYFLYYLSQEQLGRCLFPLGTYLKEEVRSMARNLRLTIHAKPESQDFAAGGYLSLLEGSPQPGPIMNRQGEILGQHRGIVFYTIGQRRGLGLAAGKPLYVTAIDREKNVIVVGTEEEVLGHSLVASGANWIAIEELTEPLQAKAKIRYRHQEAEAGVTPLDSGKVRVEFKEPQRAITPGQGVVFYNGDTVVGGGTIEQGLLSRLSGPGQPEDAGPKVEDLLRY